MVEMMARAPRRRISEHQMMLRRKRIFTRLREGRTYEEIAVEEGVTSTRIRQIVSEELQKRSVDSGADHAKLQLDRLAPVMQLAADAVAAGDVTAIAPYLKVLDRLDRYQTIAGAHQVKDDESREKLMEKINRVAANLDIDEEWAAARREIEMKRGITAGQAGAPGAEVAAAADEAAAAAAEAEKNDSESAAPA
jgi:uncharacterized protein YerC